MESERRRYRSQEKQMSPKARLAFMAGCLAFASVTLIAYGINGLANSDQVPQPNNAIVETVPLPQQPFLPVEQELIFPTPLPPAEPIVTGGEPQVIVLQPMPEAQEIVDVIPSDLTDMNIDGIDSGEISWPFTEEETVGFVRDFFGLMGKGLSELEKIFGIPAILVSIPKIFFNFYNRRSKLTAAASVITEPIKNALAIGGFDGNKGLSGDYLHTYLAFGAGNLEIAKFAIPYLLNILATLLKKGDENATEKILSRSIDSIYGFLQSVNSPEAAAINLAEFVADWLPYKKLGDAIKSFVSKG